MTLHNVIASSSDKTRPVILLSAHFDSTASVNRRLSPQAPGADDNASGVAALLELARILKGRTAERNIEFVFFNCEEQGTAGSKHLAKMYKDNQWPIEYMINLDTIGTWKGQPAIEKVSARVATGWPPTLTRALPGATETCPPWGQRTLVPTWRMGSAIR